MPSETGRQHSSAGRAATSNGRAQAGFGLKPALIALLAVALLPAGGLAIGQAVNSYTEARGLRDEAYRARLGEYVQEEQELLAATRSVLHFVSGQVAGTLDDQTACNALMERLKKNETHFSSANFTNLEGYVVCGSHGFEKPIYVGDRERFLDSEKRLEQQIDVVVGRVSGRQILLVLEPVFSGGAFIGDLSVGIPVESIDRLAKLSDDDGEARIALFSRRSGGVAPLAEDFGSNDNWLPSALSLETLAEPSAEVRRLTSRNGESYVYATAAMTKDVVAVAGWPAAAATNDLRMNAALAIGLPVLTWALASLIAYIAIDRLVLTHVRRLTRLTNTLRQGDLGARAELPANAPLEFAELGGQFDSMAERLQEREARLRRAIDEERMLLREVYHRVKNNLQLIVSLLNLQARQASDQAELAVIRQTQDRVQSLAMVHQNLYQVGRLSEARLDTILEQIVAAIRSMRAPESSGVEVFLSLEPVRIDADRAVPASLLATEALTNAFKHGSGGEKRGRLSVDLRAIGDGGFEMVFANDLVEGAEAAPRPSGKGIGDSLIKGFARQLRAELRREEVEGKYVLTVTCPAPLKQAGAGRALEKQAD